MGLSFMERRARINWNTDPKKENAIKERQLIAKSFDNGYSLPHILDNSIQEPKWQEAEDGYATFVFTESIGKPMRIERPCVDDSILFLDTDTKEVVAITYDSAEFEGQMTHYWGL